MGAEIGGELHGEVPHAPAAGMDEDALALVRERGLDDQPPGGEGGERHARGLDVGEGHGLAGERERGDDDVLRVGARGARHRRHPVDLGPDGERVGIEGRAHDDPAHVETEHGGHDEIADDIPRPARVFASIGFTPAATTRISTSLNTGVGTAT